MLTPSEYQNWSPSVCGDGRYIVYSSLREQKFGIWRMDADGSNMVRLADEASALNPKCSPDGQWVVYLRGPLYVPVSEQDAYVYQEATKPSEIIVTVNQNHPFWTTQLRGAEAVLEYLRQCIYDALAEWQASNKISRFDPDTIKWLKDGFLRLPMEIERHEAAKGMEATGESAPV